MSRRWRSSPALFTALCMPLLAHATNGYFSEGYGAKSQGQAGVAVAWGQDSLASASNPAALADVGERVDLGLTWFVPSRSSAIVGNQFGNDASYSGNATRNFFLPEFGYSRPISDAVTAGIAVYGNGGLDTDYASNPYARFGATGHAGVGLEQLFITPAASWKASATQRFGVALNIAYQRFSAKGLGVFSAFSSDPGHVSDQGNDSSVGTGLRLGWSGELAPGWTLGASWASKISGRFSRYRGLFADAGSFDVPENYALGLKFAPAEDWTFGADLQKIRYSRVAAVGDSIRGLLQGTPLGASGGPGFGWRDVTVLKLALSHAVSPDLVLRAGFSHGRQPVPAGETFFNILAPGVVENHATVGATWRHGGGEWTGYLAYAPGKAVNGANSIPPGNPPGGFGGGNANVTLKETSVGLSYAWRS